MGHVSKCQIKLSPGFSSDGKVSPSSILLQRCLRKLLKWHLTHNDFSVCWMWRMTDLPICPFSQMAHTERVSSTNVPISQGHQVIRSNLLLKTGSAVEYCNVSQIFICLGLENLQGWRRHSVSRQPAPLPGYPHGEKMFLLISSLRLSELVVSSTHHAPLWKDSPHLLGDHLPINTADCCKVPSKPPLLQDEQCLSLSLFSGLSSPDQLSGLHWTCSSLLICFLYWAI